MTDLRRLPFLDHVAGSWVELQTLAFQSTRCKPRWKQMKRWRTVFVLLFVRLPKRVSQFSLLLWLLVFPLRYRGDVRALPLLSR